MTSSGDPRPSSTSWLDVVVLAVVAVVANAAGVAAQAAWELPWDPVGRPTADVASRQRLALAEHHARDVKLFMDKLSAQRAQEQVDRTVSMVKLQTATGEEAAALQASVREKELVITRLQAEAAQAARASVDAEQQVTVETDAVAKSLQAAQRRSDWWLRPTGYCMAWRHGRPSQS